MTIFMLTGSGDFASYLAPDEKENDLLLSLDPPPVKDWKAPRLVEYLGNPPVKPRKKGEYHSSGRAHFLSEKAANALSEYLSGAGVLLPVAIEGRDERFYRYWITRVVDCLDVANSKMSGATPGRLGVIIRPAFRQEALGSTDIFRVPGDLTGKCFVTDKFVQACQDRNIRGAEFLREAFDPDPVRVGRSRTMATDESPAAPMSRVERQLTAEEKSEFRQCAKSGYRLLGLEPSGDPQASLKAIEDCIARWHAPKRGFLQRLFGRRPDSVSAALALGTVWGDQIVSRFGWQWTCVKENDQDLYGVVSPDRALAIYPTYFVKACLDDPAADCTALLAFNMLIAGSIPKLPANGYQNLMAGVRRIVPR